MQKFLHMGANHNGSTCVHEFMKTHVCHAQQTHRGRRKGGRRHACYASEHGPTQEGGPLRQARARDGMHVHTASMAPRRRAARGARQGHQTEYAKDKRAWPHAGGRPAAPDKGTRRHASEHGPRQEGGPLRQARAQDVMQECHMCNKRMHANVMYIHTT